MKKTLFMIAFLSAFLPSCKNNPKVADHMEGSGESTEAISHHEEQDEQAAPVLLNNGEKWKANEETTAGIKKMTALTTAFPAQPTPADYQAIKRSLENEFNLILSQCTMTGEAHTQLHNYLLPMKPLFEDLKSQDTEICSLAMNKLKQHLAGYENYFQ